MYLNNSAGGFMKGNKLIQIKFTDRQRKFLDDKKEAEQIDSITSYVRGLVENEMFKSKGDEHGS